MTSANPVAPFIPRQRCDRSGMMGHVLWGVGSERDVVRSDEAVHLSVLSRQKCYVLMHCAQDWMVSVAAPWTCEVIRTPGN